MQEVPTVRQSIIFRSVLQIGMSGIVLGLVIVALTTPARAGALSLSLNAGIQLPLLPSLDVTSTVSALDTPLQAQAKISVSPPSTVTQPKPSPIVGASVSIPPVVSSPVLVAPPASKGKSNTSIPLISATPEQPSSGTAQKPTPKKTSPAVAEPTPTVKQPATHNFLGLDIPNGLDFIPQIITGKGREFRTAVTVLTAAAVLFLGLATFTTARLARGSPQKV